MSICQRQLNAYDDDVLRDEGGDDVLRDEGGDDALQGDDVHL